MILLDNLTYRYSKSMVPALDGVTAKIGSGIHLLLGENGAGKTTLLHLMAGLLTPTSGECMLDGYPLSLRLPDVQSRLFFVSDNMMLPGRDINSFARVHGRFYPGFDADMLRENLAMFGLTGDEALKKMSMGTRRKSQIAYALSLRTDVLLLDEPTNGLDITAKQQLQNMLVRCISDEQTVVVSTHTIWDLLNLYDGVIALSHGKMLAAMHTWEITERLAFVTSQLPPVRPIYCEQNMGLFRSIVAAAEDKTTDIDYTLLYNALQSPARDVVIEYLNQPSKTSDDANV
ncbi:MAG: ABC transporter ATP-binding protein [Muribaculaceae bacterium]|nr:ABC transporter ATP-binding protein [Muribaculaceae bacterium]